MVILFLIWLVTANVEMIISGRWTPFYFRNGVPLFRKSIKFMTSPTISPDYLSKQFSGGITVPIIFRSIAPNEIGFREKLFNFFFIHYPPIMHGLIRVNHPQKEISVTGYANWFVIIFSAAVITMDLSLFQKQVTYPHMSLCLFAGWGILYAIQFKRFSKVLKILKEEFTSYQ